MDTSLDPPGHPDSRHKPYFYRISDRQAYSTYSPILPKLASPRTIPTSEETDEAKSSEPNTEKTETAK